MRYFCILIASMIFVSMGFAQDIAITVTNQNLALVKEKRVLNLAKGTAWIKVTDVPSLIDPTSVHIKSVDNSFSVLEQNYEYDLMNANKILHKSLGKNVILTHPETGTVSGRLLFSDGSTIMLETSDRQLRIIPRNSEQQIILEAYDPEKSGLIVKPTLVWFLDAEKSGKASSEISYLTRGLNWHAEYVSILNGNDTKMDLSAWVSLDNQSGRTYADTRLKLMAGDLNLAAQPERILRLHRTGIASEASKRQFKEKQFFEYHMYSLSRQTTIKNNQTKQIQLFEPANARISKIYNYNYHIDAEKVRVIVQFVNKKSNGLGIPLPKGKVRIFKTDDNDFEFIGEDFIGHTPKNEIIKIVTGKAFDIKAERKIADRKKLGPRSERLKIEIELRNHKNKDIVVRVTEPVMGRRSWELITSSYPVKEKDARKIEFNIPVKANDKSRLRYEVIYRW